MTNQTTQPQPLTTHLLTIATLILSLALATHTHADILNFQWTGQVSDIGLSDLNSEFRELENVNIDLTFDTESFEFLIGPSTTDPTFSVFADPAVEFNIEFVESERHFESAAGSFGTLSIFNDRSIGFATDMVHVFADSRPSQSGTNTGLVNGLTPDLIDVKLIKRILGETSDMLPDDTVPTTIFTPDTIEVEFWFHDELGTGMQIEIDNVTATGSTFLRDSPGTTPESAILPDEIDDSGTFTFRDAPSGRWLDPPTATGFYYEMQSDSLFTKILAFPPAFDGPFNVWVDDILLGEFDVTDSVDFTTFDTLLGPSLFDDTGVFAFSITGINPAVDPTDPTAFPIQLEFSTPTADLTMTAIPEPATIIALTALPLLLTTRQQHTNPANNEPRL